MFTERNARYLLGAQVIDIISSILKLNEDHQGKQMSNTLLVVKNWILLFS